MKAILSALLVLVTSISASAATYFVNSVSGNDANIGNTAGAAWKTLTTSISRLANGDTLSCSGSWAITSQSSWGTRDITIQGNGTSTVVITPISNSGTMIFNGSGVVLKGFTIVGTVQPTAAVQTLIAINGNGSTMADCTIRDFAPQNVDDEIIVQLNASSCTFSNLTFHNIADRDIFRVWGLYNKWTSCTFSNLTNPNSSGNVHADVWQTWWTGASVWSNVIERCYFVNVRQAIFQLKGTPDNINCNPGREGYWSIRNCIFNRCPSWPVISTDQFRFYNNLLYYSGQGNYPLFLISDPCNTRGRYYNNVLVNTYCQTGSSPSYGNNAFTVAAAMWGGAGDFVTTEAACKFVNPAAGDFRLQAGSSLIGKGMNLSADPSMTSLDADGYPRPSTGAWDIGPYQYRVGGSNQPPVVNAGPGHVVYLPTNTVTLSGSAYDPEGGLLSLTWSQVSGPGTLSFGSASSAVTTATFSTNVGTYVCRLSASDRTNTAFSEVSIVVNAPPVPPVTVIEALNGSITAPFAISGGAVSQPVDTDLSTGGRAVYQFTVPTNGNYIIVGQVNAPGDGANSFYINIDGQPADPYMVWDVAPLTSGFEARPVSWRGNGTVTSNEFQPKFFRLASGVHSLVVIGREAGAALQRLEIRSVDTGPTPPANLRVVEGSSQ